jgi:hypothetical protein
VPIATRQELHAHLELAIQVELTTVPPYLYAMYSIEDQRSEPARLLRSILVEEMLHAVLAANILLGVGGTPRFGHTDYMPRYPGWIPHHKPPLPVRLQPCSADVIRDVFVRIEQPEIHGSPAEPDDFETLGQFYHAIEIGLAELAAREDLFADPQLTSQLTDPSFYAPVDGDADDSGGLMAVSDLASADEAIQVIVHQGEGLSDERWADPSHRELTHYYKLRQILDGDVVLGPVLPLPTGPRTSEYPESLQPVSTLFNTAYRYLFVLLDRLFRPVSNKGLLIGELYRVMTKVMGRIAHFLVRQPLPDGLAAAPTFEVVDVDPSSARELLGMLATDVSRTWPELRPVTTALS